MERVRVLLVEDDEDDALLIRDMLEEADGRSYQIVREIRLEKGMLRAAEEGADVALLDLFLPDSRGDETYRRFRRANVTLPVIVLTGLDDESLASRALQEGCQDYLIKGRIEPASLSRAIIYAIERKRMEAELIRTERLAAVGTMISGVAHEFNNLNNIVQNGIGLVLKKHPQDPAAERKLRMALDASSRAAAIIHELMGLNRGGGESGRPVVLAECVRRVAGLMERDLRREGIGLELAVDPALAVSGAPREIEQVLRSLLGNAVDAVRTGGEKHIRVATGVEEGKGPYLRVEDRGVGIPRMDLRNIFTPFYSTKGAHAERVGINPETARIGLGLSLCQSIVQNLGGRIEVASEVGKGATFTVYLLAPAPLATV